MYSEEFIGKAVVEKSNAFLTALSVGASVADYGVYAVMEQIQITRLFFFVTTAVATSTTNCQVSWYARPTSGSTSGQVLLGTLIIPTGASVGQVIYKEIESIKIPAGYDLAVKVTVQGVDASSTAGAGFVGFKAFVNSEDPRNNSLMVKSA